MQKLILAGAVVVLCTACAARQYVEPVEVTEIDGWQVCVVENPDVRSGFLDAIRDALLEDNYAVRVLPPQASLNACPLVSVYVARWDWDLAVYMRYAEIQVYRDGRFAGEAIYDASDAGSSPGKFINAERKVHELVGQLFVDPPDPDQ